MSSECSDDIKYHNILNSSSQIGRAIRMDKKVCKNIRIVYNKIHKFNSQFGCIPYANECELKLKINED